MSNPASSTATGDAGGLAGQVVLVTGASRGIGADTARAFAARGAHVVCAARTLEEGGHLLEGSLQRTVAEIVDAGGTATAVTANLADDQACAKLVRSADEAYGPVDILVNNAAVSFFAPLAELPPKKWLMSWRVTVHAPVVLSQLVLPAMVRRGAGRIVNVTSVSAIGPGRGPYPNAQLVGDTAYGAQKAALERITQGLAEEVYAAGVGVAAVAPSRVVPTPGALLNGQVSGPDDPRAEARECMPRAIVALATLPLEDVSGRVVYSQQLLSELELIDDPKGAGVDPREPVSGFAQR